MLANYTVTVCRESRAVLSYARYVANVIDAKCLSYLKTERENKRVIMFISTGSCLIWSHLTRLNPRWRLMDRGTTLCFLLWTASQVCLGPRRHWRGCWKCHFKTCLHCFIDCVRFNTTIQITTERIVPSSLVRKRIRATRKIFMSWRHIKIYLNSDFLLKFFFTCP